MILLELALTFFKIGLLTIGGGLAMIPIIRNEMLARSWLSEAEFLDIFGIAQMTPGPISINTATFVGYRMSIQQSDALIIAVVSAGIATLAVSLPSFIFIGILGKAWQKKREHPAIARIFKIMRPLVCGLVAAAAVSMCISCLQDAGGGECRPWLGAAIMAASFALTAFTKFSPFATLLLGAAAGICLA